MPIKCPKCLSENSETKQYCGDCGAKLSGLKEISVPTQTIETQKGELSTGFFFAGRYQIIEELGTGGMGRVYKAIDTEINEKIAIKLIKPAISVNEKMIKRFQNELKYARKISHRNVCRMYDLNQEKGNYYIVMEYVPGGDLKSLIQKAKRIDTGAAVSIAKQICDGLSEAHKLGIVHRDLKPSNIMIDDNGSVRIMDFGIARIVEEKGITGTGKMIGTPEYMSPEQAEAKAVDQRSDIYSLGVILYEMVTGTIPFGGDTPLNIALKHKTEPPRDPREIYTQIPEDLSQAILKCLEKNKERRFQKAEDLFSKLRSIEKSLSAKKKLDSKAKSKTEKIKKKEWQNSIAVLPFTNMSAEPEQEYFCDGIAEEIINALTHVDRLKVIARTSAFAFKGKHEDVRDIGKKLDVDTLLEGSVRKSGNRLRITAQLVRVSDGSHLWSDRYDRNMEDIFVIQDEISLAIVDNLKIKLLGKEKKKLLKRYTNNLEAYNLYLKGLYFTGRLTIEGNKKAMENYKQVIEIEPNHALTYYGMSALHMASAFWANVPPHLAFPKVKECAEKVLEIDNSIGIAHSMLGSVYTHYEWNWKEAEQEHKQALRLNRNEAMIHEHYYFFLTLTGRHEEAIAEAKFAQKLDPLSDFINTHVGHAYFNAALYDKAIEALNMSLSMNPNYHLAHYVLGLSYHGKSMLKEAVMEFEKAVELSNKASWEVMLLACAYYESGRKTQALKLLDSLKMRSSHEYVPPMCFFNIYLVLGDRDQAYEWLKTAWEQHDSWIAWSLVNPVKIYRFPDEPRFKALLKKAGLE